MLARQRQLLRKKSLSRAPTISRVTSTKINKYKRAYDNRYEMTDREFSNTLCFQGYFTKMAAERALGIVDEIAKLSKMQRDRGLQERIESSKIAIQNTNELKNMLLIMMGASLVNSQKQVFETAVGYIGYEIEGLFPTVYDEAKMRTDNEVRSLLNLVLHAAIVTHNVRQTHMTLIYGRKNTFLLSINDRILQVALRLCEEDGPGQGDLSLIRVLIINQTVLKNTTKEVDEKGNRPTIMPEIIEPGQVKKNEQNQNVSPDAGEDTRKEKGLIKVMEKAAKIKFNKAHTAAIKQIMRKQNTLVKNLTDALGKEMGEDAEPEDSHRLDDTNRNMVGATAINAPVKVEEEEQHQSSLLTEQIESEGEGSESSVDEIMQKARELKANKANEKYLKATDFLEAQLANVLQGKAAFTELAKIVLGLIDVLDLDKTINILFESDMQEVLFTSVQLMSWRDGLKDFREQIILIMFKESIYRQQMHFSLRILAQFKNLIMININSVLPSLLQSLLDSPYYMDVKLSMIKQFLDKIQFHQVDVLISNLKILIDDSESINGILVCNTNPFIVASNILCICDVLKQSFPVVKLRIVQFEEDLKLSIIVLLENLNDPVRVSKMLKQKDIDGYSTLDMMGRLSLYKTMQTKIADRIIQDYWKSKVDVSGSMFENSTFYNILKFGDFEYVEDFEEARRFYHPRNYDLDVRPHRFTYQVWFNSMSLRYFFEMAVFGFSVVYFQIVLSTFNHDLHILNKDVSYLLEYRVLEMDLQGHLSVTKDGERVLRGLRSGSTYEERQLAGIPEEIYRIPSRFLAATSESIEQQSENNTTSQSSEQKQPKKKKKDLEIVYIDIFGNSHLADGTIVVKQHDWTYVDGFIQYTPEDIEFIKQVKEEFDYEIKISVFGLDEAMYIAMISFTFPIQMLMSYVFSRYVKRNYPLRASYYVDICMFLTVLWWFYKYETYLFTTNAGFAIADPPEWEHVFMQAMLDDINSGDFHFDWLLAGAAFLYWIRFLYMLQLTNTFGPLIRTTTAMVVDLFQFMVLFFISLIAFSCVGVLCFGMIKEYKNVYVTMIMFFQTAMGEWDFEIYTMLGPGKKYFGIVFHMIVITVNMILMLNLIIAIMSDTYTNLSHVKLGLYSQGIIEAIPVYKNDKTYGSLIVATPPLNLLTLPTLFIIPCFKDTKKLQRFNQKVCKFVYFPFALVMSVGFIAVCIVMAPFAFIKSLIHKCLLFKRTGQGLYFKKAFTYLMIGIPMTFITLFVDFYHFFTYLYWTNKRVKSTSISYPKISLKAFNMFHFIVHKRQGSTCNAKELVLETREIFKTNECIFGVLYTNRTSMIEPGQEEKKDKVVDQNASDTPVGNIDGNKIKMSVGQQQKINAGIDYNLRGLNTYNLLKRVIWSCVLERPSGELDENSEVNLNLLKGLLNEIQIEIYVEDFMHKMYRHSNYKQIDIYDWKGYDDFKEVSDHIDIQHVVRQITLIDPYHTIVAFNNGMQSFKMQQAIMPQMQIVNQPNQPNQTMSNQSTADSVNNTMLQVPTQENSRSNTPNLQIDTKNDNPNMQKIDMFVNKQEKIMDVLSNITEQIQVLRQSVDKSVENPSFTRQVSALDKRIAYQDE